MSYSLRLKGLFLGCGIGLALVTRMVFAGSLALLGPMGGVAECAGELSILIAILATSRLTGCLSRYYDNYARRRVLEEGFVKWTAELEAQKSAATSASPARKAA